MSRSESVEPILGVPIALERDSRPLNHAKESANRQREKIKQIGKALLEAGCATLTPQARALGVSRSTAWSIVQAEHKYSGLSGKLIVRMLAHKALPPAVRTVLREYVITKAQGHYGHKPFYRRRFAAYFWEMPELADFLKK